MLGDNLIIGEHTNLRNGPPRRKSRPTYNISQAPLSRKTKDAFLVSSAQRRLMHEPNEALARKPAPHGIKLPKEPNDFKIGSLY